MGASPRFTGLLVLARRLLRKSCFQKRQARLLSRDFYHFGKFFPTIYIRVSCLSDKPARYIDILTLCFETVCRLPQMPFSQETP